MNEEKKAERIIEKKAGEDSEAGDKSETNSLIERADAAAERLEKANAEKKALLDREEAIMAKQALGGRSEINKPEKPKELTDREFKEKFLKGELPNPF